MTVRSLGYRTDLLFPRFEGEVVDRGDYTVIRTPSNPTFHWGNFLLFEQPPEVGDYERWRALFTHEMGEVGHITIGWDGTDGALGEVQPFLDARFHLEQSIALSAESVRRPEKYCEEVELRVLTEDWEWTAATETQIETRDEIYGEAGYRVFAERQMARRRRMVEAGYGQWFGAFMGDWLAGDLGLFVFDGLGRFQSVGTHPDFRRRGVCGALVHYAATFGLTQMGAEKLVMVADENYHAARIYESVGFVPVEKHAGVSWWERD